MASASHTFVQRTVPSSAVDVVPGVIAVIVGRYGTNVATRSRSVATTRPAGWSITQSVLNSISLHRSCRTGVRMQPRGRFVTNAGT